MTGRDSESLPTQRFIGVVGGVVALAALLGFAIIPIDSDDLFINIRGGELIWNTGKIASNDPFSYTMSDRLWVNHEWIATVAVYLIHARYGFDGLRVYQMLLIGLVFLILIAAAESARPGHPLIPLAAVLAAYAAADRYTVRAHLYQFLFTALLMFVLVQLLNKRFGWRWALPPLTVLWVNFHSGAVLLPAIMALVLFSQFVQRKLAASWPVECAWRQREWRAVGVMSVLTVPALLLNPFTYHSVLYPFQQMGWDIYRHHVYEWMPIWNFRNLPMFWVFLALLALFVAAALANRTSVNFTAVIVMAAYTWLAWRSVRFIDLFAVAWLPLFFIVLPRRRLGQSWSRAVRLAVLAAVAVAGLWIWTQGYRISNVPRRPGTGLLAGAYPFAAFDFLDKVGVGGPMFNEYDLGSYIAYHCYPRRKVFIDGRHQLYPIEFYKKYLSVNHSDAQLRAVVDEYSINYFIMRNRPPTPRPQQVYRTLSTSLDWRLVFWNDQCLIYLRNTDANRQIIDEQECVYYDPVYPDEFSILRNLPLKSAAVKEELLRILRFDPGCVRAQQLVRTYFP